MVPRGFGACRRGWAFANRAEFDKINRELIFKAISHSITLRGPAFATPGHDPRALSYVWRSLESCLRATATHAVYGAVPTGRTNKIPAAAWEFRIGDFQQDVPSATGRYQLLLPTLGEAAPRVFEQGSLFESLRPEDTALDCLGDFAAAVMRQDRDSEWLAPETLRQLSWLNQLGRYGLSDTSVTSRRYAIAPILFDATLLRHASELERANPATRRVRLAGLLDSVAYMDRVLRLRLSSGTPLRVLWKPTEVESLCANWGRRVLLDGTLHYGPNGRPRRLDATAIQPAADGPSIWDSVPEPLLRTRDGIDRAVRPSRVSPLAAMEGVLDGEMDDEAFARYAANFCGDRPAAIRLLN
ncbi:MAG: hypothetical protein SFX74_06720 [Fimbriimonadaceae bacterium]|nr:hypothetical protein [Fimbriimonadaceae bacterium]